MPETKDGPIQPLYEITVDIHMIIPADNPVQAQVDGLELLAAAAEQGHMRDHIRRIEAERYRV